MSQKRAITTFLYSTDQYSQVHFSAAQYSTVQSTTAHRHQCKLKYTTMYTSLNYSDSLLHRSTLVFFLLLPISPSILSPSVLPSSTLPSSALSPLELKSSQHILIVIENMRILLLAFITTNFHRIDDQHKHLSDNIEDGGVGILDARHLFDDLRLQVKWAEDDF